MRSVVGHRERSLPHAWQSSSIPHIQSVRTHSVVERDAAQVSFRAGPRASSNGLERRTWAKQPEAVPFRSGGGIALDPVVQIKSPERRRRH